MDVWYGGANWLIALGKYESICPDQEGGDLWTDNSESLVLCGVNMIRMNTLKTVNGVLLLIIQSYSWEWIFTNWTTERTIV